MFDTAKYKKFALLQLKNRWTTPVLVTLFILAITVLFNLSQYIASFPQFFAALKDPSHIAFIPSIGDGNVPSRLFFQATILQLLVLFVLRAGQINLHLKMSRSADPVSFSDFFEGLGLWMRAILAQSLVILRVFLWSLLLVIPGIIKTYAYSQVIFLIIEYPRLSIRKALLVSKEITNGHKADIFGAQLSFFGWYLLATFLTAGIGLLWLEAYYYMTMTNVYHALLKEAIDKGTIKSEDLVG